MRPLLKAGSNASSEPAHATASRRGIHTGLMVRVRSSSAGGGATKRRVRLRLTGAMGDLRGGWLRPVESVAIAPAGRIVRYSGVVVYFGGCAFASGSLGRRAVA